MKLLLKKLDGKVYDITKLVINANYTSDLKNVKNVLNVNLIDNQINVLIPNLNVEVGDLIELYIDEKKYFEGLIITLSSSERGKARITVFDIAFYLEKNSKSYYFEKVEVKEVLRKIFTDAGLKFSIQIDDSILITKLFKTNSFSDIVKYCFERLKEQTGNDYFLFAENGEIIVKKTPKSEKITPLDVKISFFNKEISLLELLETKNFNYSIEDMSNAVVVNKFSDNSIETLFEIQDDNNIKKYGKLEKVIEYNADDKIPPETVAKNILEDLNIIHNEMSLKFATFNNSIKQGSILVLKDEEIKINGNFEVLRLTVSFENGIKKMDINIKEV